MSPAPMLGIIATHVLQQQMFVLPKTFMQLVLLHSSHDINFSQLTDPLDEKVNIFNESHVYIYE